ncbi:GNAT family N-acetyltransferase [Nonomuraea soli]|uniref:RimJ/RimL family protein N-acetyltransferase n=1 Tax=Nonomuraea soli TaxID=1032476 RepID=A0A7W0CMC2_9ACTN|nr:GNAT family protein [Nonomuraea soli]MBA2893817.1 RimJ/RimL family protein N-acetyltransferase [Nonomuraea soli]
MTATLPRATVLADGVVRLEPLSENHVPDLFEAGGGDDEVWRWLRPTPHTKEDLTTLARRLVDGPEYTPFAVVHDGRAIGWTSYVNVPGYALSVEIGFTWYGRAYWRTAVNTACKILLIDHAFDAHDYNRVVLKTDHLNTRSQQAIARLGAVHEGTLRRHRVRPDGTWRDSVYFGILREEWPAHRARLVGGRR